jgi:hypothetical protein
MAEDKRLAFKKDEIISDLTHFKAALSATVFLMEKERKPELEMEDIQTWFDDLSDRLDGTIGKINELRA